METLPPPEKSLKISGLKRIYLIIVMIKPFQSTNYGSFLEGEVFQCTPKQYFVMAYNYGLSSTRLQQAVLLYRIKVK